MSEGLKLFIGGLCPETDTESLQGFFGQYGELTDAIVMVDPQTRKSRGFGFVTFKERPDYDRCLSEKEQHTIDGRKVEVKRAIPRDELGQSRSRSASSSRCKRVFLGGMSLNSTEDEVMEAIEKACGPGVVDKVEIITSREDNKPRGFAFVNFRDEDDIYPIVDQLLSRKYVSIGGRDVEVKQAVPLEELKRKKSQTYYSSSRDGDYPRSRPMYDDMRGPSSGGLYGESYPYSQHRGAGRDYLSGYPPSVYDRAGSGGGGGGGGYSYDSSSASPYSSYGGKYSSYGGMMGGGYAQSPSSYGPTRGYSEYGRDRGDRGAPYHPYPRQ